MGLGIRWRAYLVASVPWVLAAVLVAAGFYSTLPVSPRGTDAAGTGFSAARAMEHVSEIAREPHPMGSAEIQRVRDYIVAEVTNWGKQRFWADGLGAQITRTTEAGDWTGIVVSIAIMCAYVVLLNKVLWQPLYAVSEERYRAQ